MCSVQSYTAVDGAPPDFVLCFGKRDPPKANMGFHRRRAATTLVSVRIAIYPCTFVQLNVITDHSRCSRRARSICSYHCTADPHSDLSVHLGDLGAAVRIPGE